MTLEQIALSGNNNKKFTELKKNYSNLMPPKIVALDLDKTVYDIIAHYDYVVNQTRIYMGEEPWTKEAHEEFHKDGFISNEISFRRMFPGREKKALEFYYDIFHKSQVPNNTLIPGTSFMLYRLKHLYNLQIIGVTNCEQHMAKKVLRDLCLFSIFDSVTGPKGARKLKPEAELLIIGLNKIGKKPGPEVWFMGDSPTDTICAKNAGCTAVRFYMEEKKPEDKYADIFINSHFDYEEIIGTLLSHYSG